MFLNCLDELCVVSPTFSMWTRLNWRSTSEFAVASLALGSSLAIKVSICSGVTLALFRPLSLYRARTSTCFPKSPDSRSIDKTHPRGEKDEGGGVLFFFTFFHVSNTIISTDATTVTISTTSSSPAGCLPKKVCPVSRKQRQAAQAPPRVCF